MAWGGPAGHELFVAVADATPGTAGAVMTSPNGITWTARTAAAANYWSSVAWGGLLGHESFVAVAITGTGDRVMTSPDGITWSSQSSAADNSWSSVAWGGPVGDEVFAGVSYSGVGDRVMTSAQEELCPPPPPPPPAPATAPRSVVAAAGDASASVSWESPLSTGSFSVSTYQVVSAPGGRVCLVPAQSLSCEVTGLINGTSYRFTVQALTGAGWSPSSEPSNAVTPIAAPRPSVLISGSRAGKRIEVTGQTTGFGMGGTLRPWLRFAGQSAYSEGAATILVSMDGTFDWGRTTGKRVSVYVQTPDGSVRSNAVTVRAR